MKTKFYQTLYFWVILAVILGGSLGAWAPDIGSQMKPIGDAFISLVKMLISPIVFCTVVLGVAGAGDMKKVGRVGGKALIYFEVVSTLALILGLAVGNWFQPGHGFDVDLQSLSESSVEKFTQAAHQQSFLDIVLHIIPKTFLDAFTGSGDLLQVLFLALLFGYGILKLNAQGQRVHLFIEEASHIFFSMMNVIMKLAPVGAGASMAFTIGKFGIDSLIPLANLMLAFYGTCLLFIIIVLGLISRWVGFSIFKFIRYIQQELLMVLGTSSSESALVPLMQKLERLGCGKSIVGLVIPSGYSFNLDGTNIYLTLASLFIAQAMNVELTLSQQLSILGVAMLTSKGASGVTGAGFITLAATLAIVPDIPVQGLALILGVDRFMSEARSITNFIGNGVATLFVSAWEKDLDRNKLKETLKESFL